MIDPCAAPLTEALQKLAQRIREQQIEAVRRQIPDVEARESNVHDLVMANLSDLIGRTMDGEVREAVIRRVAVLQPEIERILFGE